MQQIFNLRFTRKDADPYCIDMPSPIQLPTNFGSCKIKYHTLDNGLKLRLKKLNCWLI